MCSRPRSLCCTAPQRGAHCLSAGRHLPPKQPGSQESITKCQGGSCSTGAITEDDLQLVCVCVCVCFYYPIVPGITQIESQAESFTNKQRPRTKPEALQRGERVASELRRDKTKCLSGFFHRSPRGDVVRTVNMTPPGGEWMRRRANGGHRAGRVAFPLAKRVLCSHVCPLSPSDDGR